MSDILAKILELRDGKNDFSPPTWDELIKAILGFEATEAHMALCSQMRTFKFRESAKSVALMAITAQGNFSLEEVAKAVIEVGGKIAVETLLSSKPEDDVEVQLWSAIKTLL